MIYVIIKKKKSILKNQVLNLLNYFLFLKLSLIKK
jgi:hypothetical protein